ncbi:CAP domain-containing protein [Blastococcus sp. BMG 814]|uniref:CAP domain-containing protein n=1 Tax=Blastococcus carthaginiensis TaxID=3050034 RepID=A0ABT9ID58_9ACTN|nr:CAP domain-containing protein [Blastococcus carthaginiensis]MDP5183508.1 CAP domain-containing protein [Blastococcus carthaginiensis]
MPATRSLLARLLLVLAAVALPTTGCVVVDTSSPGTGAGPASTPAPDQPPSAEDGDAAVRMARAVFERVNDERAARDLAPLEWDESLAGVARDWSEQMAGEGRLEHQDIRGLLGREELSGFAGVGENIFTASASVPAGTAHVGWMRSDEHRVNVLNPGWNRIGIGFHCAPDGSVWATQEFGRTTGADRPELSQETPPQEPIARPAEDGPSCS